MPNNIRFNDIVLLCSLLGLEFVIIIPIKQVFLIFKIQGFKKYNLKNELKGKIILKRVVLKKQSSNNLSHIYKYEIILCIKISISSKRIYLLQILLRSNFKRYISHELPTIV